MSAAQLRIHEVTADLRDPSPDRPVIVGNDGTRVVLLLDAPHAEILAKIIARISHETREGDDLDLEMWDRAVVDLLCAKACASGVPAPVPYVLREVAR